MFLKNALLFACLALVIASCGNGPAQKEVPLASRKKIAHINFFMETSGSMAGYLKGNTDFRSYIPNLLVNVEGKIDSGKAALRNFYIDDSARQYSGTTQDFIKEIAVQSPAHGKSSQMQKIFETVAQRTDSNDISLFVSDCILSYPDDVIRKDININQTNAPGDLKSSITRTFLELKKKNIGASVYAFNSSFNGTYYDFQNNKITLNGDTKRPYFIWVLGNRDLLIDFNRQLQEQNMLAPVIFSMDFGLFTKPVDAYSVLFSYERQGKWETDLREVTDIEASEKAKARFAVALDLSTLPLYAQDTNYLRQRLKVSGENVVAQLASVKEIRNIDRNEFKSNEKNVIQHYTHIGVLQIPEARKSGTATLTLPLNYDTLYKSMSIMDDRNKSAIAGKTFALEHLIDGVRAAYQDNSQNFIQLTIPVKK